MKNPAELHVERANVAAEIGRHRVVERECRKALAADPKLSQAYELLAWTLMEQRRHDEALRVANTGLGVRADRAHLHYIASVVLHRMNLLVAARIRAEAALKLSPQSGVYTVRLARILLAQGDKKLASSHAREALALAPESNFVLGEVALTLCEAGDIEAGREIAVRRLRLNPDDVWALAGLCRAEAACRNPAGVVTTASEVIKRDPNLGWIWALYAEGLDAIGQFAAADAAARETLRLSPYTLMGGAAVARVLCEDREWARAEKVAVAALDKDPANARAASLRDRARRRGVELRYY